jgi:hypothetical protein
VSGVGGFGASLHFLGRPPEWSPGEPASRGAREGREPSFREFSLFGIRGGEVSGVGGFGAGKRDQPGGSTTKKKQPNCDWGRPCGCASRRGEELCSLCHKSATVPVPTTDRKSMPYFE